MSNLESYASETFLRNKLARIYEQFLSKTNCDVLLNIENQLIPAHSCVLASASDKLRDILQDYMKENCEFDKGEEIHLEHFTVDSFNFLAPFIYRGFIDWNEIQPEILDDVLNAARHYGLYEVNSF